MPIDEWDRDRAKHLSGLLGFITAQFMWSMESQDDLRVHPSFADFASGMLWQHDNNVKGYSLCYFPSDQIAELKRRFPPRKLKGLIGFVGACRGGKNNQRKTGELPNRLAVDGSNGGIMRALTFRERCEKKRRKLPRQSRLIPGGSRWSACAAKSTSLIGLERISSQTLVGFA